MIGAVFPPTSFPTRPGNGIAASALQQGGGEFHNFAFNGDLPNILPAPEPASATIFGLGAMCALGALGRRRD